MEDLMKRDKKGVSDTFLKALIAILILVAQLVGLDILFDVEWLDLIEGVYEVMKAIWKYLKRKFFK
tara:strand:- start:585 stop:782 length:198 start_codon:yes stop_codon:yes gene_type:complete